MGGSDCKLEIIYDLISKKDNVLSVTMLCDIAGVSRSGYYRWVGAAGEREKTAGDHSV